MGISFTVVVPTHNRRESLLRALASVRRQTRPALEVIVVADGCSDGSAEAVRELREPALEVLDLPKGPGLGWVHCNRALEHARGDVVAYLSDDDLWLEDHLARVGEVFDLGGVDLVQASSCRVAESGEIEVYAADWGDPRWRERLLDGIDSHTPMSAVSHRRALAAEVGGWNESPPVQRRGVPEGDLDLWQRMVRAGARTAILREVTVINPPALRRGFERRDEELRAAQHREYFERLHEPGGVARLRLAVARAGHAAQADLIEENVRLRADRERAEQYALSLRDVLAARDGEIANLRALVQELGGSV